MDRFEEMYLEMAVAVYSGDVAKAAAALDLLRLTDHNAARREVLGAARRKACPVPPAPRLDRAEVFPVPGHLPGSFLGGPILTLNTEVRP